MLVQQSYRYELKPNNKQKTLLSKHAGCARFAYNWGLARRMEEHKETQKSSNAIEQHRQLNALKKTEFPWMYEVSKCAPQEALRDLDKAYKNFFRSIKSGKKIGFPKFKKKGVNDSFRLTGSMRSLKRSVVLPRLGEIRTKERTNVKGRILSVTVSREADRWFVAFAVERKRGEYIRTLQETAMGVDVGINSFCVLSDGTKIESPKPLEHSLKLLKRRSKQHSRKKIGSANRKKSALKLARLHRKIRNRRSDFLHKVSTMLAKTKSAVAVEDLNVKGMVKNRHLSLRISDAGWSEFLRHLDYKTKWYGSSLVKAPKFYPSSKMCSSCKTIKENFKLSDRIFRCDKCGLVIDRDVNAAINLKYLATGSSPGSYACRDTSGGGIPIKRESTSHVSLKQEADAKVSSGIFG
ncbi:MAG: IS200/IS605 family element transposase accessory protein TnpB [Actinobacteria bacterium]|nr:IS200/IS605 family element transposase accessory protein TnpB [Actinomycetota bacterium]